MITVSVYRYDPETDEHPYMQDFEFDAVGKDFMVLDVLEKLKIEDPTIKMERKNKSLGMFDLSSIYQKEGLRFQGPRPKAETIKLKTIKGRIKIDMNIKKSLIYFEPGVVRVAIDLEYK